jgi:MFS superfamily sulfate permease-like transporter
MNPYVSRERIEFRRRIFVRGFKVLILGIVIGVVLGYFWHYKQVTGPHRQEVSRLTERIEYYHNHWTPMRETPVRTRQK